MNQIGSVIIETYRLLLRQFTKSDTEAVFNNWTSDEKFTEFLRWLMHKYIDIIMGEILTTIGSAGLIIEVLTNRSQKNWQLKRSPQS